MSGRAVVAATLALAVAACTHAPAPQEHHHPVVNVRQAPELTAYDLKRDLEATVLEGYAQLSLGNIEAYADGIADDRPIVLLGVGPQDVVWGRNPPAAKRDPRLFADRHVSLLSKNLGVHLSQDDTVGWTFDEISYRVPYMGREASIPIRVTGVYVRDVDRWVLVMQHESYALPRRDILALARAGKLATPHRIIGWFNRGGPALKLRAIVVKLLAGAEDTYRKHRISSTDDALILWPGRYDEYHGAAVETAPPLARVFGSDKAPAKIRLGGYRVMVAPDLEVAWMAANLHVETTYKDAPVAFTVRATYVFENRHTFGWEVVQTDVSVPISQDDLSRRVFGTVLGKPGAPNGKRVKAGAPSVPSRPSAKAGGPPRAKAGGPSVPSGKGVNAGAPSGKAGVPSGKSGKPGGATPRGSATKRAR